MKIAVMQPYYYPYAGYFRLFAATDLFVFLDCVQFNRRGRVHRCQYNGKWIHTLPIKKTNRDTTLIKDLEWQDGKEKAISPIDLIIGTLQYMCNKLRLPFNCARSSGMLTLSNLKGQDLIIAICKELGATEYINSPGGKDLYDQEAFAKENIKLTFLPEYVGSCDSIFERLAKENPENIRKEIYEQI